MRNPDYHRRRGSYFLTFAFMTPVLFGFVAASADYGALVMARNQAQAAADAAAMAAATSWDEAGDATARNAARTVAATRAAAIGSQIRVHGHPATVTSADLQYGFWDGSTFHVDADGNGQVSVVGVLQGNNAVRASSSVPVSMPFMGTFLALIGANPVDTLNVGAAAGAAPNATPGRAPDTVLVLDTTWSMSNADRDAMSEAALALVNCVDERSADNSRAAVVKFTGVDNVALALTEYDAAGAEEIRGALGRDCSTSPPGIGNKSATLGSTVGTCSNDPDTSSYTNQAAGLAGARWVLENAETPPDVGQAIVLFSDGQPMVNSKVCNSTYATSASTRWNGSGTPALASPDRWERCAEIQCSAGTAYTTQSACEAARYCESGAGVQIDALTTQATCEGAGHCERYDGLPLSYSTQSTCEVAGVCIDGSGNVLSGLTTQAACEAVGVCSRPGGGTSALTGTACTSAGSCTNGAAGAHSTVTGTVDKSNTFCRGHSHSGKKHTWSANSWTQSNTWLANNWNPDGNNWVAGVWSSTPTVDDYTTWAESERDLLAQYGVDHDMDVKIFTVFLDNTGGGSNRTSAVSLMSSLTHGGGTFYDVSAGDYDALMANFQDICIRTATGDPGPVF